MNLVLSFLLTFSVLAGDSFTGQTDGASDPEVDGLFSDQEDQSPRNPLSTPFARWKKYDKASKKKRTVNGQLKQLKNKRLLTKVFGSWTSSTQQQRLAKRTLSHWTSQKKVKTPRRANLQVSTLNTWKTSPRVRNQRPVMRETAGNQSTLYMHSPKKRTQYRAAQTHSDATQTTPLLRRKKGKKQVTIEFKFGQLITEWSSDKEKFEQLLEEFQYDPQLINLLLRYAIQENDRSLGVYLFGNNEISWDDFDDTYLADLFKLSVTQNRPWSARYLLRSGFQPSPQDIKFAKAYNNYQIGLYLRPYARDYNSQDYESGRYSSGQLPTSFRFRMRAKFRGGFGRLREWWRKRNLTHSEKLNRTVLYYDLTNSTQVIKKVRKLIDKGARPEYTNSQGNNAFMIAASNEQYKLLEWLLRFQNYSSEAFLSANNEGDNLLAILERNDAPPYLIDLVEKKIGFYCCKGCK